MWTRLVEMHCVVIQVLVGVQPFFALLDVPFPLPTPQGRRAKQLKTRPECWIRGLREASTQGIEATSANPFAPPDKC